MSRPFPDANAVKESVLFDRAKLLILTTIIAGGDLLTFNELVETTQLTKGNLSSHLRKLEGHKLVKIIKKFEERKPVTSVKITDSGRAELKSHLAALEKLIRDAGRIT